MKKISRLSPLVIGLFVASVLSAQGILERDLVPLKNWDAPMYWQPSVVESNGAAAKQLLAGNAGDRASSITAQAQAPANSLVFVGMTPCRVVDTRGGAGTFGGPALIGGTSRTFPIPSGATCSIPTIAQAYSFNITVVPNGFLDYITVWPTGQVLPLASTLNGYVGTVIANAAIVPAGTNGSIDVFASQNTHLIIDINGYYAAQTGITLAQGTAGAPALSFAGDSGTGIFSSGASTLNIATNGVSRLTVASNGDLTARGNVTFESGTSPILYTSTATTEQNRYLQLINSPSFPSASGLKAGGLLIADGYGYANPGKNDLIVKGDVGIGTNNPATKLEVDGGGKTAVFGGSTTGFGISGYSADSRGVNGLSVRSIGVYGESTYSYGVYGTSFVSYAGYFSGNVHVTGTLTQGSDARLKQEVASLGYGLREVLQLRPVSWNWKAKPDGGRHLGLIAQEVETVLPELVTTETDTEQTKGLNYIGLVPVTIKAIQEQQAQIEDQQKLITEQHERLEQQQRQLDSLKELICLDRPLAAACK